MKKDGEHEARINLFKAIVNSQEIDMLNLANTLHENVAQELYAIRLLLQRFTLANGRIDEIDRVKKMLNTTISEVQEIANHLLPAVLRDLGFAKAINDLILQSKKKSIKFTITIDPKVESSPIQLQIHVYRIVQEFLQDISQYDEITEIYLKVRSTTIFLVLEIFDNRVSLDQDKLNKYVNTIKNSILYYDGLIDVQNVNGGVKQLITLKKELDNDKNYTC